MKKVINLINFFLLLLYFSSAYSMEGTLETSGNPNETWQSTVQSWKSIHYDALEQKNKEIIQHALKEVFYPRVVLAAYYHTDKNNDEFAPKFKPFYENFSELRSATINSSDKTLIFAYQTIKESFFIHHDKTPDLVREVKLIQKLIDTISPMGWTSKQLEKAFSNRLPILNPHHNNQYNVPEGWLQTVTQWKEEHFLKCSKENQEKLVFFICEALYTCLAVTDMKNCNNIITPEKVGMELNTLFLQEVYQTNDTQKVICQAVIDPIFKQLQSPRNLKTAAAMSKVLAEAVGHDPKNPSSTIKNLYPYPSFLS